MGWFSKKTVEEYRLLDKRTPKGGVVFWVRDAASARDDRYVSNMLSSNIKRLPTGFIALMSAGQPMMRNVLPISNGECEVHLDFQEQDSAQDSAQDEWDFQDAAKAAKALCDVVLSQVPALSADQVGVKLNSIGDIAGHQLARGPRSMIEPLVNRALSLTVSTIAGGVKNTRTLGYRVGIADATEGAFVFSMFRMPDGSEKTLPLLAWRGKDGLIYAAFHPALAPALGLR